VVRDGKGKPLGDLTKEDFRVFDNRKPQVISHFAKEVPASKIAAAARPEKERFGVDEDGVRSETELVSTTPTRFLALYFDDVHAAFEDLVRTREAAERYLETSLQPGDRVGVFTSSGENILEFTDDRNKLREAMLRLKPRRIMPTSMKACPDVHPYQAYLIVHENNPQALEIATEESLQCNFSTIYTDQEMAREAARNEALAAAVHALTAFQLETEYALRGLELLVRRLAGAPGQRSIILISPGFLTVTKEHDLAGVVERALRANVVINTLDARGLAVSLPLGDATTNPIIVTRRPDLTGRKAMFAINQETRSTEVLRTLAYDTGGEYFGNNNDLDQGFRKTAALPEVYYVLGFSPQNLRLDGRFHSLKVELARPGKFDIQARAGYFAPRKPQDPNAQAKEEIEQAIFSHDELNELPVEVHTQFFKFNELDARLSVLTHLNLRFVAFRKEGGRNLNNLTLVTALFDRDGKYVTGKEKVLEFQLLDGSLEKLVQSGITAKMTFDVKAGTYMVRQVVRDSEGARISALNRTIEIPY
jgi:VWFA-related protein